jgi:CubicO group peptidase (beta-lactamase class C family)
MPEISSAAAGLEAALGAFVLDSRLPGAAAAVVCGTEPAWSAAVGFADVAAGRPARPGTLYRIASVTKTVTGTAVMRLRDAGQLDLDEPAIAHLPELRRAAKRVRAGRGGDDPPDAEPPVRACDGSAGHKYSDLAYQLLGEIVTRVSGVPYPRYVTESILVPLGMLGTSFEPLDGPLKDRCLTCRRCGLRAGCGRAPRTSPGGSRSS